MVHPLCDSKEAFIPCGSRKKFLHLLCDSREVSSSIMGFKGGVHVKKC